MAILLTKTYETGPNGADVIASNANEQIVVKGSATFKYSNNTPATGSFCGHVALSAATDFVYVAQAVTAAATLWHGFFYRPGAAFPPAVCYIGNLTNVNTAVADVRENTDGTLSIRDRGATSNLQKYTTPTAIPRSSWVWIAYRCTPGSATGLQLKVYVPNSSGVYPTTATYDSGGVASTSSQTAVSEAHSGCPLAMSATVANAYGFDIDTSVVADSEPAIPATNAPPAPPASGVPPTVALGADQVIPPSGTGTGPTVTFTAQATASSPATVSSYNWRTINQTIPGSLVPNGATATFVSPVLKSDAYLTAGVVVTDSTGLVSTEDRASARIIAQTEWHNQNGILVPMKVVNADGTISATPTGQMAAQRGVNSAGADFGDPRSTTYLGQYDSDASFAFYTARGHKLIRIPFLWERIQPTLGGALDATERSRLTAAVSSATTRGLTAVIDVHNYCRYKTADGTTRVLGDGYLTNTHLTDLWSKLAPLFSGNTKVQFGLMNEPHDLPGVQGAYTVTTNRYLWAGSTQGWADEQTTTPATVNTSVVSRQSNGTNSIIVSKAPTTSTGYWNVRVTSPAPVGNISAGGLTMSVWVYCPAAQTGWQAYVAAQSGGTSTPAYSDIKATAATPLVPGQWTQLTYTLTSAQAADVNRLLVQIESNAPGTTGTVSFNLSEFTTGSLANALNGAQQWEKAAQACVTAIRAAGAGNWIWVPGYNYAAARSYWTTHPTWFITDSAGQSGPEGHHYFDGDRSGTYTQSYATVNSAAVSAGYANLSAQNVAELKAFTDGCVSRNLSGFVGEYGWTNTGGADQTSWNNVGAAGYTQLKSVPNISIAHWAAGEAWGSTYNLSVYTGSPQSVLTSIAATVEAAL